MPVFSHYHNRRHIDSQWHFILALSVCLHLLIFLAMATFSQTSRKFNPVVTTMLSTKPQKLPAKLKLPSPPTLQKSSLPSSREATVKLPRSAKLAVRRQGKQLLPEQNILRACTENSDGPCYVFDPDIEQSLPIVLNRLGGQLGFGESGVITELFRPPNWVRLGDGQIILAKFRGIYLYLDETRGRYKFIDRIRNREKKVEELRAYALFNYSLHFEILSKIEAKAKADRLDCRTGIGARVKFDRQEDIHVEQVFCRSAPA